MIPPLADILATKSDSARSAGCRHSLLPAVLAGNDAGVHKTDKTWNRHLHRKGAGVFDMPRPHYGHGNEATIFSNTFDIFI